MGCPVSDNPSQMFQCLTINPQAFIDLISKGDYKSFCHMANGYMTCMTTYVRDCLGGKAATGILEELQDLNLKCCISGRSQECVVKNPALLQKCFSSDNLVTLSDGRYKNIMDIKPGDVVKAIDSGGNLIDSEVVDILHKSSNHSTLFQILYDLNGNSISLTSSHLINLEGKGYVNAASLEIGDRLRMYSDEDKTFKVFIIGRIEFDIKKGFVAPLTQSGTLLVNKVDTSCYAQVSSHYLADITMAPVKLWYRLKFFVNTIRGSQQQQQQQSNNQDVEISAYAHGLYKLATLVFSSYLL